MSGWAKLPHELREEFVRGDITLRQFTVACFLLSAIDAGRRGEAAYTGRALADALHWKQSPEYLRRTLVDLRDGGWFVFSERTRGDRSPYLLRYGPKLTRNLQLGTSEESLEVGLGEANLQLTGLLELEVDVQQAEVAGPASPHEDSDSSEPGPPTNAPARAVLVSSRLGPRKGSMRDGPLSAHAREDDQASEGPRTTHAPRTVFGPGADWVADEDLLEADLVRELMSATPAADVASYAERGRRLRELADRRKNGDRSAHDEAFARLEDIVADVEAEHGSAVDVLERLADEGLAEREEEDER